ncbi:hypothetical protein SUGI_1137710 [Cryptomeria japonica]|nr:hypothetical protein SUGI_1137710 [Cryptomeria japonica]
MVGYYKGDYGGGSNLLPSTSRPKSFSEAVAHTVEINAKARFDPVCPRSNEEAEKGHRRRDCPVLKRKLVNSPSVAHVNPPDKNVSPANAKVPPNNDTSPTGVKVASSPNPSSVSKSLNPSISPNPSATANMPPKDPPNPTGSVAQPHFSSQIIPAGYSGIDLNSDDGFIIVQEKKKRKAYHGSRQKIVASDSINRSVTTIHQGSKPIESRQEELSSDLVLNTNNSQIVAVDKYSTPNNTVKRPP